MSGCTTAKVAKPEVLKGLAPSLLGSVPAVLAMHYTILDSSMPIFSQAFYGGLASGLSPEESLMQARRSLCDSRGEGRVDWGTPILYLRISGMRLIERGKFPPNVVNSRRYNVGNLRRPSVFLGRDDECQMVIKAIMDRRDESYKHYSSIYIYGLSGIGKSAFLATVLKRVEDSVDGSLVISCISKKVSLQSLFSRFAEFFKDAQHMPGVADIFIRRGIPIDHRVAALYESLKNHKYLFVFDGFDAWLTKDDKSIRVIDEQLDKFFQTVSQTYGWRSKFIFTSRYLYRFEKDPLEQVLRVPFGDLTRQDALHKIQEYRKLVSEEEQVQRGSIWDVVGGNPGAMELLNGFLGENGLTMRGLLKDSGKHQEFLLELEEYLCPDLRRRLSNQSIKLLSKLSAYRSGFDMQIVNRYGGSREAVELASDLSLITRAEKSKREFSITQALRTCLERELSEEENLALQRDANAYYSAEKGGG
jgi:hypothetical protein